MLYLSAMERASVKRQSGDPFSEANAWAILDIAFGGDPRTLNNVGVRSRTAATAGKLPHGRGLSPEA